MNSYRALARLFIVYHELQKRNTATEEIGLQALLEKVNAVLTLQDIAAISDSTLKRDISDLRKPPFNVSIVSGKKGYILESKDEMAATSPIQFFEPYYLLHNIFFFTGLERLLYPEPVATAGLQWLYPIVKHIKERHLVRIEYSKHNEPVKQTNVFPIVLKQFKGIWYLIGKDKDTAALRTFGLDRIDDIVSQGRRLNKPEFNALHESLEQKFKDSYGIYADENDPVEEVVLKFDKTDIAYLRSNPLHHTQKYSKIDGTISVQLRITEDFKMALLSRMWSLEVIKPLSLRSEVKNWLLAAIERHK